MGADFIEKATPSFRKAWDRARVALATADLFTRQPECMPRSAVADIVGNPTLGVGEHLTVEESAGALVARRGTVEVARFTSPPREIVEAVRGSCSIAKGTVERVHPISGAVEISVC